MEIKAYIKTGSVLGLKPVDIYREACDIMERDKCPISLFTGE